MCGGGSGAGDGGKQRARVQSLSEVVADARTKRHRTPEETNHYGLRPSDNLRGTQPARPGGPAAAAEETLSNPCVAIIKNYGRARR